MLTVLFNAKEFARVNLLPQATSFTAACFVDNVVITMANQQSQGWGYIARRKMHLHFDNSKGYTAQDVQEEIAIHWCVRVRHPPCSPDLVVTDSCLFERSK
jgi:hypothetical protein